MRKLFLAAGVAALAIIAPASADPGKNGNGKDRDRGAKVERGGGGGDRAHKAQERRAESPKKMREHRRESVKKVREQRAERGQKVQERRFENAKKSQERSFERAKKRDEQRFESRKRFAEQRDKAFEERSKRSQKLAERVRDRDRGEIRIRDFDDDRRDRRFAARGLPASFLDGCPPGLRDKNDWCLPPGQFKKAVGSRLPQSYASHLMPLGLRDIYRDSDDHYWRYGDGYAYRVNRDRDLVSAILPLIGAGFGVGMPFPYSSQNYYVPNSYQSFYRDSPYSYYRYANGYVYEIDRNSGMIEDVIPLLDQGYGVGQMLPASYSYYNLPYQYRDWYQDDDDYLYRYAPGAIYQVDRETQMITAIASLLTGNNNAMMVGQPMPMGYSAYNVPYAYRDRYYDSADNWYRYSNGNIYQVDPTTRLITAVIDAIV